jgi:hypothetical protein
MLPWERARNWHDDNTTESFESLLAWHMAHGLVFNTPEVFLLAHEVRYSPDTNTMTYDLPPNAWFVELAASVGHANPVREFMRVATRPQEWAIWHRRNSFEPHAYLWSKLARRVGLGGTTSVSSVAERGVS